VKKNSTGGRGQSQGKALLKKVLGDGGGQSPLQKKRKSSQFLMAARGKQAQSVAGSAKPRGTYVRQTLSKTNITENAKTPFKVPFIFTSEMGGDASPALLSKGGGRAGPICKEGKRGGFANVTENDSNIQIGSVGGFRKGNIHRGRRGTAAARTLPKSGQRWS